MILLPITFIVHNQVKCVCGGGGNGGGGHSVNGRHDPPGPPPMVVKEIALSRGQEGHR